MREERSGRWLLILAASCATFSVVFGVVAWMMFRDRRGWTSSDVIAAVGVAAGLGGVVGALFGQPLFGQWLAEIRAGRASSAPGPADHADRLAQAVKEQWTAAAAERGLLAPSPVPVQWKRSSLPVAGPVSAALGSENVPARFEALPGLTKTGEAELRKGGRSELHAVYGGLASGRLIIVGQPGSGKTGAAILLVLDALAHRERSDDEDRRRIPVPVLLTLQGWDPRHTRFEAWLVTRLAETYPLFAKKGGAERARALLSEGRLTIILDGLDEIPKELRAAALRSLSEQAVVRVVILTRSAEMVAAASEARFLNAAAIELQDVEAKAAAEYLAQVQTDPAPAGWQELIERLEGGPDTAVAAALGTPLALTLVRDTYRGGQDVRELLDIADRAVDQQAAHEDVENHLLDRILSAAYAPRLGEPTARYDLASAERALRYIATRMNDDRTRDLRWWTIARWAPTAPRAIVNALITALVFALAFELLGAELAVIVGASVLGLMVGALYGIGDGEPEQAALRWRQLFRRRALVGALGAWLAYGVVLGLVFGLVGTVFNGFDAGLQFAAGGALVGGFMSGLVSWIYDALRESVVETTSPLSPVALWRADRRAALPVGLVGGVGIFGLGAIIGSASLITALIVGPMVALMATETWPARLAFLQLAAKRRTPARLIGFLEDARERGVLRTVGPLYQFRHARLQDRLGEPREGVVEPGPSGDGRNRGGS